jgi:hypothetical protein
MGIAYESGPWGIVGHQTAAILLTIVITGGPAVAQDLRDAAIVDDAVRSPLPANLIVPDIVRPLVTTMWRQSFTFRRQCARLAENPTVVVTIELDPRKRHGRRALTRIERQAASLHASVQLELRTPQLYVEHIAHELEHVLEHVDGADLPRLARQGVSGVENHAGQYETARARSVGRTVAREAILQ